MHTSSKPTNINSLIKLEITNLNEEDFPAIINFCNNNMIVGAITVWEDGNSAVQYLNYPHIDYIKIAPPNKPPVPVHPGSWTPVEFPAGKVDVCLSIGDSDLCPENEFEGRYIRVIINTIATD